MANVIADRRSRDSPHFRRPKVGTVPWRKWGQSLGNYQTNPIAKNDNLQQRQELRRKRPCARWRKRTQFACKRARKNARRTRGDATERVREARRGKLPNEPICQERQPPAKAGVTSKTAVRKVAKTNPIRVQTRAKTLAGHAGKLPVPLGEGRPAGMRRLPNRRGGGNRSMNYTARTAARG
jgi:hypothetical protein